MEEIPQLQNLPEGTLMKQFWVFAGKVAVAHTVTYFVLGGIAYQLLTKPFYVGPDAVFDTFMRTEAEPQLWRHVMSWFLQAQLLRGLLIAAAIYPFFSSLIQWTYTRRWLSIAGLYVVLGFWAAAVAAPGTIEGMVYLRPEITPLIHLKVQPEIIVQGLLMSAWISRWMVPKHRKQVATT